uniref:Odorant receptor n=1 Tax=Eucryptorrhynchus scrobiculatus TaxID=1552824 RepID=A0A8F4MWW3_EUCSC|nr:odorant receptor 37 [Eucryptorrhynchus scrobiculatus]
MDKSGNYRIMQLHITVLKYLFLWPREALTKRQNTFLMYGYFYLNMANSIPVMLAAVYQFYVGIEDVNALLESLIGICDIIGYTIAYINFLKSQRTIQELIIHLNDLAKYSGNNVIQETNITCTRYTKYLLGYVTLGVMFNAIWPLMTIKSCIKSRVSEFYVKHDPCGLTTHNFYPFDASKGTYFWMVFTTETMYCFHMCYFFSLATAIVVGFLMHIIAHLKCCSSKFEHVFDAVDDSEHSDYQVRHEFANLIKYHQALFEYAGKVFGMFDFMIVVYVSVTSFPLAITGYQIINPTANHQDRIRYGMLLVGWVLLLYLICFYAQQVIDESVKLGDSIYNSRWYKNGITMGLNKSVCVVLHRTQRPLNFKVRYLGMISLERFVLVMKTSYSVFTLLITVTADE